MLDEKGASQHHGAVRTEYKRWAFLGLLVGGVRSLYGSVAQMFRTGSWQGENPPPSETAALIRAPSATTSIDNTPALVAASQRITLWLQVTAAILDPTRLPIPNPFSTGAPITREILYEQAGTLERGTEVSQLWESVLKRIQEMNTLMSETSGGEAPSGSPVQAGTQAEGDNRPVEQPGFGGGQKLLDAIIKNAHDKQFSQFRAIVARKPSIRYPRQTNMFIEDERRLIGQEFEMQVLDFLVELDKIDKLPVEERHAKAIEVAKDLLSQVDDLADTHNKQRHQGTKVSYTRIWAVIGLLVSLLLSTASIITSVVLNRQSRQLADAQGQQSG
ncbi:hypothetical protein F5Y18DRAFT_160785 [Xylariaceae sp. FL1019]|nr:hypothetical protein F5Y18DRAFT_160785 [Xylariaceae sp. FL1019]